MQKAHLIFLITLLAAATVVAVAIALAVAVAAVGHGDRKTVPLMAHERMFIGGMNLMSGGS